jgi:cellulose synthase/poly-beta-1,6-N-acetylglucosamine synthase-like glycosyltransferase
MNDALLFSGIAFLLALFHGLLMEFWRSAIATAQLAHEPAAGDQGPAPLISVLVPARNATGTIVPLLQDLHAQQYPRELYEVLVIDDGSDDGTATRVADMAHTWPGLRVLQLIAGKGKKAAIARGVQEAQGVLVLVTDADARCGPGRLKALADGYGAAPADLLLLPVRTVGGEGLAAAVQRIEQTALQAAACASALGGRPVLASGANMAFRRDAFLAVGGYDGDRRASGDDMFLLQRMRRHERPVGYLADARAVVTVAPEPGWSAFFSQRIRWAGKMWAYRDPAGMFAGLLAVAFPWALLALSLVAMRSVVELDDLFHPALLLPAAWALWAVPIVRLVRAMDDFFGSAGREAGSDQKGDRSGIRILLTLLAFTLYAPVIAILSIFVRPIWRGRRI